MTDEKPASARLKIPKYLIACAFVGMLIGLALGASDFSFTDTLDAIRTSTAQQDMLGIDPAKPLSVFTFVCALFMVFMCLLQGVVLIIARLSPAFSAKVGVEAQFGDGRRGRAALWRLGAFWLLNGALLLLLGHAQIARIDADTTSIVGASCVLAIQLWTRLDELVRNIWVEATALTCGIMLGGAMLLSLLQSMGVGPQITLFEGVLIYNYLYLVIYFLITFIRAPATLTDPMLEGE
jgi:hypothetical protein